MFNQRERGMTLIPSYPWRARVFCIALSCNTSLIIPRARSSCCQMDCRSPPAPGGDVGRVAIGETDTTSVLRNPPSHPRSRPIRSTPVISSVARVECVARELLASTTRLSAIGDQEMRTPSASVKRFAGNSGVRVRGTRGGAGSGRKRRRNRVSRRLRSAEAAGLPGYVGKVADED